MTVYADIDAARTRILVLVPGGADYETTLTVARGLKQLTPLFKPTEIPGALQCPLSWSALVQLRAQFGEQLAVGPGLEAWTVAELVRRTDRQPVTYSPPGITPYPWQVRNAAAIAAVRRVVLHDEPGTGKSLSTVLGLSEINRWPVLVVCPASVVSVWVDQWQQGNPDKRIGTYLGPKRYQQLNAVDDGRVDVLATSYDTFTRDAGSVSSNGGPKLDPAAFVGLVLDEYHALKNRDTSRSKAVRSWAAKLDPAATIVGLSGTPVTHDAGQLWPVLNAMTPAAYPSRTRFVDRYVEQFPQDFGEPKLGSVLPYRREEFDLTLLGQVHRTAKADVLPDLPPKIYQTRTVAMPAKYRKAYDGMESDMLAELESGDQIEAMDTLSKLTRLVQLASAAADVEVTEEVDEATGLIKKHYRVTLKNPSWKIDAMIDILAEREDRPVVVAAPSRQLIMLAGKAAEKAGRRVGYIVGGQQLPERTSTIKRFQAGELDWIGLTTGAGQEGITLTAADTLVFLQRPWSLTNALQTEDRLHRIGAEHESIQIIDVVTAGTIEARVRQVLRERGGTLADVVADPRVAAGILGGKDLVHA